MRVDVHDAVFADGASGEDDRDELVLLALRGRHHVVPVDVETPALDALLAARGWSERWRHARETNDRAFARVPQRAIEVGVWGDVPVSPRPSGPRLDLAMAVRLLKQPLRVMLENGRNDGKFLRALATLDGRVPMLDAWLSDGRVVLENGGGLPEMRERLGEQLRDPLTWLRVFAVFDSDALTPGRPSDDARELDRICARASVGHHPLARRSAENYLPPPRLASWSEQKDDPTKRRVRAWTRLSAPQRHHFHMREGLSKDDGNPEMLARRTDDHSVDLYADLAEGQRKILAQGFGREARELFDAEHPEWERWLRNDGQADEVHTLFRSLLSRM